MATNVVGESYLTLKDKFSQMENGKVTGTIIDILATSDDLIADAIAVECNEGSHHKTTVRNGLPEPEFRQFYQGVKASKGEYTQVTDTTGMLEDYAQIDKALADLNADTNQFRMNESQAHLQGMNNTLLQNILYGNKATNPAGFDGLSKRYCKLSKKENSIGERVIDAGGTGTRLTSIWFITWGNLHTHLLYPKGSQAGIQHKDLGEVTVTDANGRMYQAYRNHFKWDVGLSVRDFRSTVRIANIDLDELEKGNVNLIDLMIMANDMVDEVNQTGSTKIYANRQIRTALHKQISNKANVNLTLQDYAGKKTVHFLDKPIRRLSQISCYEERVLLEE